MNITIETKNEYNEQRKTDILRNIIVSVIIFLFVNVILFYMYEIEARAEEKTLAVFDWENVTNNTGGGFFINSEEFPIVAGTTNYTNQLQFRFKFPEPVVFNMDDILTIPTFITYETETYELTNIQLRSVSSTYNPINKQTNSFTFSTIDDAEKRTFDSVCIYVKNKTGAYSCNLNIYDYLGNFLDTSFNIPTTSTFTIPYDYGVCIDVGDLTELTIFNSNQDATIFGYRPTFAKTFDSGFFYKQSNVLLNSYIIQNNLSGTQIEFKTESRNLIGKPTSVSFYKQFTNITDRYIYLFYPALVGNLNTTSLDNLNTGEIKVWLNHPCKVKLISTRDYVYGANPEDNLNNDIGTNDSAVYFDSETNKWLDSGSSDGQGGYNEYDTTYRPSASIIDTNDNLNSFFNNLIAQLKGFFEKPIEAVNNLISTGSSFFAQLSGLWSWLPSSIVTLITSCLTITLTIGLIKVFL